MDGRRTLQRRCAIQTREISFIRPKLANKKHRNSHPSGKADNIDNSSPHRFPQRPKELDLTSLSCHVMNARAAMPHSMPHLCSCDYRLVHVYTCTGSDSATASHLLWRRTSYNRVLTTSRVPKGPRLWGTVNTKASPLSCDFLLCFP